MTGPVEVQAEAAAPEKTKAELFQENEDRFEDLERCLFVVKRGEDGRLMILNRSRSVDECFVLEGLIRENMELIRASIRQREANTKPIIKANGGFLNGLRNLKNK